ncbi:bifunctional DNA-binding transcriptional regulator/O6-methylguanine-DNA methyltransferase Ada [Caenispirillum salinarum]|uniref:bifunctional DNA-binding transcriptional regulator/O6-methylguanine-DNA methyltransferase Ada n=1 Tax=Caenispirillum salinarum TaxID=859058 RepID=UPI00384AA725
MLDSTASPPIHDARWRAVLENDATADGRFVYAVRTTGIYCKPSCCSRPPRRGNVATFDTPAEAEAAGFRACKRCRPDAAADPDADALAAACRLLETAADEPALGELAGRVGLTPAKLRRLFRDRLGVTPKAYAKALKARRLTQGLKNGATVTEALYGAGYGAPSRAYAAAGERMGMTPTAYARGGQGEAIRYATAACAFGRLLVATTARGLCAVELGADEAEVAAQLRAHFPKAALDEDTEGLAAVVEAVAAHVEAPGKALDLPLDIRGTAFQETVWAELKRVPPSETVSYAELARRLGRPDAARAVAGAVAANRLAVVVPCHRVVRGDGGLSGYRWGAARKRALLKAESGGDGTE